MDYLAEREPTMYAGCTWCWWSVSPPSGRPGRTIEQPWKRLRWLEPQAFGTDGFGFSGCLFSNELIDALPVHRVMMTPEGLREIYVTLRDGGFAEEAGICHRRPLPATWNGSA